MGFTGAAKSPKDRVCGRVRLVGWLMRCTRRTTFSVFAQDFQIRRCRVPAPAFVVFREPAESAHGTAQEHVGTEVLDVVVAGQLPRVPNHARCPPESSGPQVADAIGIGVNHRGRVTEEGDFQGQLLDGLAAAGLEGQVYAQRAVIVPRVAERCLECAAESCPSVRTACGWAETTFSASAFTGRSTPATFTR